MSIAKTCPICSKSFECPPSHAARRICCGKPCYKKWMRQLRAAEKPKRWTCVRCGKPFNSSGRAVKYCSRECREKELQHKCEVCGKPFWLKASHAFRRKCCSTACAGLLRGESFQRGGSITKAGYRMLQFRNRRILEHRHVMESILGRPLRDCENVHHKNGQRADNRPENLELWVTNQPSGQRPEDKTQWAFAWLESVGYPVTEWLKAWVESKGYVVTKHEGSDPAVGDPAAPTAM